MEIFFKKNEEVQKLIECGNFLNGFHVYFQPIHGNHNEVLFRISEYIASGFFHNSQILKVDHQNKRVVFRYIPVLKNNCVFPIRVCSHFIADIFVNTQILLKMTIKVG